MKPLFKKVGGRWTAIVPMGDYQQRKEKYRDSIIEARNNGEDLPCPPPPHPQDELTQFLMETFPSGQKGGDNHIAFKGKACRILPYTAPEGFAGVCFDPYSRLDWAPLAVQQALWK